MGKLLASLPLEQRAERYRQLAAQAVIKAREETDPGLRAEYLTMASGWHAMAVEAERKLGRAISGDAVNLDQPKAPSDKSP